MHTFLRYFNETKEKNIELNQNNFDFLCNAIKIILNLNENEDIDYNI